MLEDRIIVQDRGIDAGLAALMQNANKGMDPAALMAMMNNGGFGGNGGWWWIWIILIFFCWGGFGGNGFGRGGNDASRLASQLNNDANTNLLMQAINGNKEAISSLSNTLNCDINAVQTALNTINSGVSQISCDTKLSSCEVININTIHINKEKKPQLNAMKKWLSAKYYQISWEQIMNQLERMIKYQNYRKKLVS